MRRTSLYITVITVLSYFGCDNENALDCFKKTGEIIQEEISLEFFNSIEVLDEIDVYLYNSNEQKVIIKAGKNLIPKIKLEVNEQILSVRNDNRCNWRRSPGNPGIYIYLNDLKNISIFDFSNFYTEDTLVLDKLHIYSDGTGNFDMKLDADSIFIESIYISNYEMAGKTNFLHINFSDDSQFFGRQLKSSYCEILHYGSNRIELYPLLSLIGSLQSTGSLYYFNDPDILDVKVLGSGELIDQSD
jgi:hypothetical protein